MLNYFEGNGGPTQGDHSERNPRVVEGSQQPEFLFTKKPGKAMSELLTNKVRDKTLSGATFRHVRFLVDWQKTRLDQDSGIINSAWCDLGVLETASVLRIEADGFNRRTNAKDNWGWYLNLWSGNGRNWTYHPEASRLLHLNPRPRANIVTMNHFLRCDDDDDGKWGPEKVVPIPPAWTLENAARPFLLELKRGDLAWDIKINGELQPAMSYNLRGNLSKPVLLQLYNMFNPRVSVEWRALATSAIQLKLDWKKTKLTPENPSVIDSAWTDLAVAASGDVWRIEADGFYGEDHPNAAWGWFVNIWSVDGRNWIDHPKASRLLYVNPKPHASVVAINHCLEGECGLEKEIPIPSSWHMENAGTPFALELQLGPRSWSIDLNGVPQPQMVYDRKGNFSKPLRLQIYGLINPRAFFFGSWGRLQLDWQKTEHSPGLPTTIDSAWCNIGWLKTGSVLRIEADGFNGVDHPEAKWGWYLNVWNGNGRNWTNYLDAARLLHFNPRPRANIVAINHCLKGKWGLQRDTPIPVPWKLGNAATPFVLELELGPQSWAFTLNGKLQPQMSYPREGSFIAPLVLQLHGFVRPQVFVK